MSDPLRLTDEQLDEWYESRIDAATEFPGGDSWQICKIIESAREARAALRVVEGERDALRKELLATKAERTKFAVERARFRSAIAHADDALIAIQEETERRRFGSPDYDITADHIWESAMSARSGFDAALAGGTP
jgi:hypothetical protein